MHPVRWFKMTMTARCCLDRRQGQSTHLLKVAEFVVLAQLFKVIDSLGVVQTVVVVDLAVTRQLTELSHANVECIKNSLMVAIVADNLCRA